MVEALHVTDATSHKKPDYAFGFWSKMRVAVDSSHALCAESVRTEDGPKGEGTKA